MKCVFCFLLSFLSLGFYASSQKEDDLNFLNYLEYLSSMKAKLNDSIASLKYSPEQEAFSNKELLHERALTLIWIEENTRAYVTFDWEYLHQIARKTSGKQDEKYTALMLKIVGKVGELKVTNPCWIQQYQEIFGSSKLGEFMVLKLLRDLNHLNERAPLFRDQFEAIRTELFENVLHAQHFEHSQQDVLKELQEIYDSAFLNEGEKALFLERIQQLTKLPDNFQFNCQTGTCTFG